MQGWEISAFGDAMRDYDLIDWAVGTDENEASEFLAKVAGGGRALELGVGSGRVAIPLAAQGVPVVGIEGSASMAEQLTRKRAPGVEVVVGDFADVAVPGPFQLVFCAYNSFFLLLTQQAQVRCFRNLAAALAPGGAFVIQGFVPEPYLTGDRQHTRTLDVAPNRTVLITSVHDPVTQRVDCNQVVMTEAGNKFYPLPYRYSWPSELDLMATIAGLELESRDGGWQGEPYTGEGSYVAVYRKPVT
jgi:SAM-dependent methyltransferase